MKQRRVVPEILDSLPHEDPEALRSRRDIRRINAVMGGYRWIARQMRAHHFPEANWIELGAGSGDLAGHFDNAETAGFKITGLDRAPRPADWPPSWNWQQGDLFDSLSRSDHAWNAASASLILHHFDDSALRALGRHLSQFRVLIIFEPARYRLHHFEAFAGWPLMNQVTRHDSHVSINAGFRGNELPDLLGLDPSDWDTKIYRTWLGAYRLLAIRKNLKI